MNFKTMTQIETELSRLKLNQPIVLTIGVFDGVHLGHQALIAETIRQAKQIGALSGVITFSGHPRQILGKHRNLPHLTSVDQRIKLLKATGIDRVITLTFNNETASLPAADFIGLLVKYLSMKGLVVGPDFALGKGRGGDIGSLKALSEKHGYSLTVVSPRYKGGHKISSTLVRKAMAESDMKRVHDLLGRCFSLEGNVIRGEGRGAKLGIPTANLEIVPDQALPADGVYATIASIDGREIPSITNIGTRPTFGAGSRTVETHMLDYSGQLYGRSLEIAIIEQLRTEEKFTSPDKLLEQIKEDIAKARQILKKTECA